MDANHSLIGLPFTTKGLLWGGSLYTGGRRREEQAQQRRAVGYTSGNHQAHTTQKTRPQGMGT